MFWVICPFCDKSWKVNHWWDMCPNPHCSNMVMMAPVKEDEVIKPKDKDLDSLILPDGIMPIGFQSILRRFGL